MALHRICTNWHIFAPALQMPLLAGHSLDIPNHSDTNNVLEGLASDV